MKLRYGPYSPSRLETATCPYSFYRQYIDPERRVVRSEGIPQARGSAVHEVFEYLTQLMKESVPYGKPFQVTDALIHGLVTDAVRRHPAAYPETKAILDMARRYASKPPPTLTSDSEVELRLAVKFEEGRFLECSYDDPEAMVRGRADIMVMSDDIDKVFLYDHKTQPNIEAADTFQLGLYAWVISKVYPFLNEIYTVLHFARYGSYSKDCIWVKDHARRQLLIDRGDMDPNYILSLTDIEDEVMARISIIEGTENWETAIPHKNCQYCPVITECPALKEVVEFNSDGIPHVKDFRIRRETGQAVKVAGYLNLFEDIVKQLKEELKEHVSFSGNPISIPGKVYCFRPTESVDWDQVNKRLKNKAYAIFEKHGIDPKQFMSFNQTASKGVWLAGNEQLVKELTELFPVKTSTEFRGVRT
jgi:hypothetical protein